MNVLKPIAARLELNISNILKKEVIETLRDKLLVGEGLAIPDAILRIKDLCDEYQINFKDTKPTNAQLNPLSKKDKDQKMFEESPSRQDAIDMLTNMEWDENKSAELGLTDPT